VALPQLGPTIADEFVTCVRRKLERDNYYVDKVSIFESPIGVDALRFHVGNLFEDFGKPTLQSTETVVYFSKSI